MNNIKLLLLFLLLIVFLTQNFINQEYFGVVGLNNYIDTQISDLALKHEFRELRNEIGNGKLTLSKNKLLFTLFYDKYDEYSYHFYDDSMKTEVKELNELKEANQEDQSKFNIDLKTIQNFYLPVLEDVNKYNAFYSYELKEEKKINIQNSGGTFDRNNEWYFEIKGAIDRFQEPLGNKGTLSDYREDVNHHAKHKFTNTLLDKGRRKLAQVLLDRINAIIYDDIEHALERKRYGKKPEERYGVEDDDIATNKDVELVHGRYYLKIRRVLDDYLIKMENVIRELQGNLNGTLDIYQNNMKFRAYEIAEKLANFNDKNKPGAWNQIRQIHKYGGDLYLNQNFIDVSEILCDVKDMEKCHKKISDFYQTKSQVNASMKEGEADQDTQFSTELEKLDGYNPAAGVNIESLQIGKYIPKNQPLRDDNIVDKLPKVILSFVKPVGDNGTTEFTHHIIEYNGIYNYNDRFNTTSRDNMLIFLQETIDKELLIQNNNDKPCFNEEGHVFPSSSHNFTARPFYYDYGLVKCAHCCYFKKA